MLPQSTQSNRDRVTTKQIHVALIGNPNCGKTAIFNALTGSKQRVANYAGVTIDKKHGFLVTADGNKCTIVDLPGTYSLNSRSVDEQITRDIITSGNDNNAKNGENIKSIEQPIDILICVIDATNITNGLRLALELKQYVSNKPIIIAFNMADIAKRNGYQYDLELLSRRLDCFIVSTTAIKKQGIDNLVATLDQAISTLNEPQHSKHDLKPLKPSNQQHKPNKHQNNHQNNQQTHNNLSATELRNLHKITNHLVKAVTIHAGVPSRHNEQIDKILLHPVYGMIILVAILFTLFQAVFSLAKIPQDILQGWIDSLGGYVSHHLLAHTLIGGLLGDGIIAGVGAVIVFLPQILMISLFIILLEDSGYMARAAFLMDRMMAAVGLQGKAFIPLLSSFACAIPGIMATRTIENRQDRLITILISPLITCSARLPIYTLLISAFIPSKNIFGIVNLQGLVMLVLYFSGIIFALIMALIFKLLLYKSTSTASLIELPSYKLPHLKNVLLELIKPAKSFLTRAGTIIVAIMIILWALSTFPYPPAHHSLPDIDYSFVGIIGRFIAPIFTPIGFNWQIVAALIPGVAAREVAVSALGTIYALGNGGGSDDEVLRHGLSVVLHHSWSLATALALITWYVFAPQCISTLAVAKRETNSWRYPMAMFVYQLALAYAAAFVVYHTACLLLGSC